MAKFETLAILFQAQTRTSYITDTTTNAKHTVVSEHIVLVSGDVQIQIFTGYVYKVKTQFSEE